MQFPGNVSASLRRCQSVKRPLLEAELTRFKHYAPRVKRILLADACTHLPLRVRRFAFSPSILDACESCPYGTLLPNLRVLRNSPDLQYYRDYYRSFPLLFGPNVRDVSTWCPGGYNTYSRVDEGHYKWMLTKLYFIAPNLRTLNLNADHQPWVNAMSVILSSIAINTSSRLRAIQLGTMGINIYALEHLANLPSVIILGASFDESITAENLAFLLQGNKFPKLQEVELIHKNDLSVPASFVRCVRPTIARLQSIKVRILDNTVRTQHVAAFLSAIASRENSLDTEVIVLECRVYYPDSYVLTEDHLRPLFGLRRLRHLDLGIHFPFDIDNATLERVAAVWPNLTVLKVGYDSLQSSAKVTLHGLIPLAHGCPRLETLGLTIDGKTGMDAPPALDGAYGSLLFDGPSTSVKYVPPRLLSTYTAYWTCRA